MRDKAPLVERRSFPYTLTDDAGVKVTVRSRPARIVALGPHFTETLFRLGLGDSVVGTSGAETFPLEATAIASVLSDDGTPNTVRIGELAPDLVIVSGPDHGGYKQRLRGAQIAVVTLDATGLPDSLDDMIKVGRLVGRGDRAFRMVDGIRTSLARSSTSGTTKVFIEALYPPLVQTGSKGYLADLVEAAGGELVATAESQTEITPAEVAALFPDIYLAGSLGTSAEDIAKRPGFASIPAVAGGKVGLVSDDLLFFPGPRCVAAIKAIRAAMTKSG